MRRALGLILIALAVLPRAAEAASLDKPARPAAYRCGRHVAEVVRGAVRIDGKSLESRATAAPAAIAVAPAWRRDCSAVAWVEMRGTDRLLVVVPSLDAGAPKLSWALPPSLGSERIFWVGRSRIAVGVALLQPRAMASWL